MNPEHNNPEPDQTPVLPEWHESNGEKSLAGFLLGETLVFVASVPALAYVGLKSVISKASKNPKQH